MIATEIKLTELKRGQSCTVAELNTGDESILRKLMSMGILPGMTLKVLLTYPSYVIQIGYTQVAVDKTVASAIMVYV